MLPQCREGAGLGAMKKLKHFTFEANRADVSFRYSCQ